MLDEFDLIIKETARRDEVGVIIGVPTAWSDMLVAFAAERPDIPLKIGVCSPKRVKPYFSANKYDLWITTTDAREHGDFFNAWELCENAVILAVHKSHPFAHRESVSLRELKEENFIFPFVHYAVRAKFENLCRLGGFAPKIVDCAGSSERVEKVSRNEGVAFMECFETESTFYRDVVTVKISDLPPADPCYICSPKGRKLSPNAQVFLNFALRYYGKAQTV